MADQVTQEILLKVAADTSEALSELKKLTGESEKGSKDMVKGLADIKAGIELVAGAYKMAKEAVADYAKDVANEHAAVGVSVDQLRESTKGLISDDDLLALAAKANANAHKLTQQELNAVTRAMVAFRNQGKDLGQVQQDIANFLETGSARSLRQYGINVEGATSKTEEFTRGLAQLTAISKQAGADAELSTDAFSRAGVTLDNSLENVKDQLVQIAIALEPLVRLAAALAESVGEALGGIEAKRADKSYVAGAVAGVGKFQAGRERNERVLVDRAKMMESESLGRQATANLILGKQGIDAALRQLQAAGKQKADVLGIRTIDGQTADQFRGDEAFRESQRNRDSLNASLSGPTGLGVSSGGVEFGGAAFEKQFDPASKEEMLDRQRAALAEFRSETILASEAFGTFQDAAVQAFSAVALGTDSLSGAFKKLAGQVALWAAQEMLIEAGKAAVRAAVALASLDFRGAAQFGLAAALAGAKAAVFFGIARMAGAGGGGGSSASIGAGAAVAGLGAGAAAVSAGGGGPTGVTIVLGNDFAAQSQNQRSTRVRRALEDARVTVDPHAAVIYG